MTARLTNSIPPQFLGREQHREHNKHNKIPNPMPQTHRLYCPSSSRNWLELIRSGAKTIDNRSWDLKRRQMRPGDTIEFWNNDAPSVFAEIIGFAVSDTFLNLYSHILNPRDTGCESANEIDAVMNQFFDAAEIAEFGVVGIKIRVVNAPAP